MKHTLAFHAEGKKIELVARPGQWRKWIPESKNENDVKVLSGLVMQRQNSAQVSDGRIPIAVL